MANIVSNAIDYAENTVQQHTRPNVDTSVTSRTGSTSANNISRTDQVERRVVSRKEDSSKQGSSGGQQAQQAEAEAAAELERQRQEALDRQRRMGKDQGIAEDMVQAQRERRDSADDVEPASTLAPLVATDASMPADQLRVPTVDASAVGSAVADSDQDFEQVPRGPMNTLASVDPETGEVMEFEGNVHSGDRTPTYGRDRSARAQASPSEIAEALSDAHPETEYMGRSDDFTPSEVVEQAYRQELSAAVDSRREADAGPDDEADPNDVVEQAYRRELDERMRRGDVSGYVAPGESPQDTAVTGWTETTDMSRKKAMRAILEAEDKRHKKAYRGMHERRDDVGGTTVRQQSQGDFDVMDFEADEDEAHLADRLRRARNMMLRRFLNPFRLRVQGTTVESREVKGSDGKVRTYSHIKYSDRVERAIGSVRTVYGGCSIYNVMQLVQLRGGIGVSVRGLIGNINPDKFSLTEDQFVELCRDIVTSQGLYGHPMGEVRGRPGGNNVRDDTGRFVVVAGTRCFPLGYMPTQLISDLRRYEGSPLRKYSESQIETMVGNHWINNTYPQLVANTSGNSMFQARAIENMIRGLMMADGKDPQQLDIPEVEMRKTLMTIRAEEGVTIDPHIQMANDYKHRTYLEIQETWSHKHRKTSESRRSDGSKLSQFLVTSGERFERICHRICQIEMFAKAANIMIIVSSIPESVVADIHQGIAGLISDRTFSMLHGDIAADYAYTDDLDEIASSKEAVEAVQVIQSLYRIGGWDAIDMFCAELPEGRGRKYRLTNGDLRRFLEEWGLCGPSKNTDEGKEKSREAAQRFGAKQGQEAALAAQAQHVMDMVEDVMLGTSMMSQQRESRQLVMLTMSEMAMAQAHNLRVAETGRGTTRESYTSSQVAGFGRGARGGEEMIWSLMQTDSGREAFMTQGVTGLGRKSPVEHTMRLVMAKNGVTELAVRTMFDRFPEYGVNKFMSQMPFCNTISYLMANGITSVGELLYNVNPDSAGGRFGRSLQMTSNYQMGSRLSFMEGLRKNLLYDSVLAGSKLMTGILYFNILQHFGGVHPPENERDRYNPAEWIIGDDEDAVPIRWAWWMDDLSGLGLPLGLAFAICEQGDWSYDARVNATRTFINMVANFNDGTAVFDVINLVNNFDQEFDITLGVDVNMEYYDPDWTELWQTRIEQGFWDLFGDMTPTMIGQLCPWSKDYLLRKGTEDAHTASRVYNVGEGSKYTMEEAQEQYKTKQTGSYSDYVHRRASQTNLLEALFYDYFKDEDTTGYLYTEQPLDTMVDEYVWQMFNQYFLDLDPSTSDLPFDDQEALESELYARAEAVCQHIDDNYQNAYQAYMDGFCLNYDARINCINYCYHQIDLAWDEYNERISDGWLEDAEYDSVVDAREETINHYLNLIHNYFESDDIPWSMSRYVRTESDRATRYVDDDSNAMTYLDTLSPQTRVFVDNVLGAVGNSPLRNVPVIGKAIEVLPDVMGGLQAHDESYYYGNRGGVLPFYSPITKDKGYNYETIPYWVTLGPDGEPLNDLGSMYDTASQFPAVRMGRNEGKDTLEHMWAGQGSNLKDDTLEDLNIPRGGIPTLGSPDGRPWRLLEETFPDSLKDLTAEEASKKLGIKSSYPEEGEDERKSDRKQETPSRQSSGGWYYNYGGGSSYGGSYYGGGSSAYNPKIYSSHHNVYSSRPSGMSTRQPYKPTTSYLRPGYYTSGSRQSYRRQR